MNVTLLTCACDRPEAFELCETYMARQTVKPLQWLVLDDDETPTKCTAGQEYYHWPEYRGRGSLVNKIRRALTDNLVKGDALLFIENDDWYAPDYIEWSIAGLRKTPLFGEGRALYYNVQHKFWYEHQNLKHASLCATSLTRSLYPWLLKQCTVSSEPFLDVRLWNYQQSVSHVSDPYANGKRLRRSVGIKAMPGRTGYGGGHRGRDKSSVGDPELKKLRSLIGDDADLYAKFYNPEAAPLPPEKNGYIAPTVMPTLIAKSEAGRVHGPNWFRWLGQFRDKKIVGMEIGTFEGDSAEWFVENICTHGDSRFHCIDPFTGSVEHRVHNINVARIEQTARAKLARFPNVVIHKEYSQIKLRQIERGSVDFFYIDGDHASRSALRDGVLVFELLKVGGVGIFDDLNWAAMPNELDRPKTGIEAFLKCYAKELRALTPRGSQVAFTKIAD